MSDSLLERVARRPAGNSNDEAESDVAENHGCFGLLRGMRDRSIMLELRKKDGHVLAIGYAWIERVEYAPDQGILLHLPGRTIRIVGFGLNVETRPNVRLLDGIIRHRVRWISEGDYVALMKATPHEVGVEHIEWQL